MRAEHDYSHLRAPGVKERPEFVRRSPRIVAGVARGLSVHIGGHVATWRWAFALGTFMFGLGALIYIVLAVSVPKEGSKPAKNSRIVPELNDSREEKHVNRPLFLIAGILLVGALGIYISQGGYGVSGSHFMIPFLIMVVGAGIAWSHPVGDESAPITWTIIGGLIAIVGALLMMGTYYGAYQTIAGLSVGIAVLITVSIIVAPVLLHNRTRLREEYAERIRESERADIAAHLHDSVLQTLALIRSRAEYPEEVATLARAQERDLRKYLYSDRSTEGTSVADDITKVAADIEDRFHVPVDVVTTGDAIPSHHTHALIGATREAITNAAKHASGAISVYAQLSDETSEVFVRDRGQGFIPEEIPADRAGIRDSIRGRIAKVNGETDIRSPLPTGGTEVRIKVWNGKHE